MLKLNFCQGYQRFMVQLTQTPPHTQHHDSNRLWIISISHHLQTTPTAAAIFTFFFTTFNFIFLPFQRLCIPNMRKLKNTVTPTKEMVAGAVKNCL